VNVKFLIAFVVSLGLASPAFARNYYVVQNSKTGKCSVLPKKPKGKTVITAPFIRPESRTT
jgi:hypothetical protein